MTLCQNSAAAIRRPRAAGLLPPRPPHAAAAERPMPFCRHINLRRRRSVNLDENVIPSMVAVRRGGGGNGISDPDHQVKGESLLHVL